MSDADGGTSPPQQGRGAANDNAWVARLLDATPAPVSCWGDVVALAAPAADPEVSAPSADTCRLEQRLWRMAELLEEVGTPAASAAADQLRAIHVPTLLARPIDEAQALLQALLDSFRSLADALAAEQAAVALSDASTSR